MSRSNAGPAILEAIVDGRGQGDVADRLLEADMDPRALRPVKGKDGRTYLDVMNQRTGKVKPMIVNAPSTLSYDQWKLIDDTVVEESLPETSVWETLRSRVPYNIPNGMDFTMIQHQSISTAGEARLGMDAVAETKRDRQEWDKTLIPLPLVWSDFSFTLRELRVAKTQKIPLDTGMVAESTRNCRELIEQLTLGILTAYAYGGYKVYGFKNHPNRITKTFTLPTSAGWTPQILVDEVMDSIQSLQDLFFNGPYIVFYSPGWTKYMGSDYSSSYSGETLKSRLRKIDDIALWQKADFLTGYQMIIVQLTRNMFQAITGMRMTTIQWDASGGFEKKFKVVGMNIPRLKLNGSGNIAIVDAVAA